MIEVIGKIDGESTYIYTEGMLSFWESDELTKGMGTEEYREGAWRRLKEFNNYERLV